jgi:hypothetical protein
MADAALREDVIEALKAARGVSVTLLPDGSYEIAAVGQPVRRYAFKATVARRLLWRFVGWYEVPIAAFFKSYRVTPQSDAVGE